MSQVIVFINPVVAVQSSSLTLIFAFFPVFSLPVLAASSLNIIDLTDTATVSGNNWTYDSGSKVFTINDGVDVTVSGSVSDGTRIVVNGTAIITLDGVSISATGQSPLLLNSGASLTLILADGSTNTLTASADWARIQVPAGTILTIRGTSGDGSLTVTGGANAAGIGGAKNISAGTITIYGGSGTIIINGGDVTAKGGVWSAGIGSGSTGMASGDVDRILIYGENTKLVAQNGGYGAQDIGIAGTGGGGIDGEAGSVFVALTPANLTLSDSPSPEPNSVAFSANPASGDTITATLPAPFSTTIGILSSPGVASKNLSVITTSTTESISFVLAGYLNSPISKTGSELMQSGATVPFSISDATLSDLVLSQGTLSTTFAGSTYTYATSVVNSVSSLTVSPMATDANATVMVNGMAVASGAASDPINLSTGDNTVTITVTAQDGTTMQTYTVTVTRAQASGGGRSSTIYYTITASAGNGGSISSSGNASVAYGKDKTYTITAEEGYEIEDLLVDGVSVGAVATYTFENVKKAIPKFTISVFTTITHLKHIVIWKAAWLILH